MRADARLRIARPTDRMEAVIGFYRDGLGMGELGGFQDHQGFDGVMLGIPDAPWHLEFTRERGGTAGRAPGREHLLVIYLPEPERWRAAVDRMISRGHAPVPSHNPYWDQRGLTFEDPDGYRVVLQNAVWPA